MSDSLEQKKAKRFRFLHALYDRTGGDQHQQPSMWDIGSELGLSQQETDLVVQYLEGEHLLEFAAMGGYISINHYGVLQVEQALSAPEKPTQYFPPVINVLHIGNVSGSSIQQTGANSVLTATVANHATGLRELATELRQASVELGRSTERSRELEANISTLEAQASSPSPNPTIVREALNTVRNVLEGMTGSLLATGLIQSVCRFLGTG
jgi:hypothetical protein